jgi:hypothetical protein
MPRSGDEIGKLYWSNGHVNEFIVHCETADWRGTNVKMKHNSKIHGLARMRQFLGPAVGQ